MAIIFVRATRRSQRDAYEETYPPAALSELRTWHGGGRGREPVSPGYS